jgi:fibronectin-binding autotransporter adhesin
MISTHKQDSIRASALCQGAGATGAAPARPAIGRAASIAAASMLATVVFAPAARADTPLVDFDFENAHFTGVAGSNPTPTTIAGDTGMFASTSSFTGFHSNASTIFANASPLSAANGGGTYGASANYWTTGDYWQFNTSSTGYNLTTLSFAENGSNTGPRDFELEYSLNNTSYTNIAAYNVPFTSNTQTFNLSGITALDNQSSVYFRLVNYDTVNVINNGQAVQSGGTDRIDNIIVSGVAPGAASGSLTFDPTATAGGTASTQFTTLSTVKNFIDSGLGTDVAYADGNAVTFSNAGVGAVVVQAAGVSPSSVAVTNTTGTYTFSGGSINGTTAVTKTGAGTLVLSATNAYSGGTIISGGIVQVSADADLGTGSITLNGGELQTTAGFTSAKVLNFSAASTIDTQGNAISFTGIPTGSAALTVLGSGNLTLGVFNSSLGSLNISSRSGSVTLDNTKGSSYVNFGSVGVASTITGTLFVGTTSANVIEVEPIASAVIGGTGSIQIAPGSSIDQYAAGSSTISAPIGVTSAGGVSPFIGAGTGSNGSGRTLFITGPIQDGTAGAGAVIFGGPTSTALPLTGKVVLSGANTYSLGTTVTAGTVVANSSSGSSALGSGTTVVTEYTPGTTTVAGTLAGNGYATGPVVIAAGGTITAGSGSSVNDSIGALHTGAQSWNNSGGYTAKVNGTTVASDALVMGGLTIQSVAGPFAGSPFVVTLQNVSGGSTVLAGGTQYVLAVDTNLADVNVFANAIGTSLTLTPGPFTSSDGNPLTLVESDTATGEDLDLDVGTVATPEPTSLLLAGLAAAPLALGRRRRTALMA